MTTLSIPASVLADVFRELRACGCGARECVVYLCGPTNGPERIERIVHPRHRATRGGYEVESSWVNEFFLELRDGKEAARMQVHTHPGLASHSLTDDTFALVPATGFLSLVIPDFAQGEIGLARTHLVVMTPDGTWRELDAEKDLAIVE